MPRDHLQITARNRPRVMAEITSLLVHRRVDVISLAFTRAACDNLRADLTVEIGDPRQRELLRRRLCRLVDVLSVANRPAATTGEDAVHLDAQPTRATRRRAPNRTSGMGARPPPPRTDQTVVRARPIATAKPHRFVTDINN